MHEVYESLIKKYPKIFSEDFCIECPEGWCRLIGELCRQLQHGADKGTLPQVTAEQVKFKWGTMCFYYSINAECVAEAHQHEYIQRLVRLYEGMTVHICSQCGSSIGIGMLKGNYLCNACRKKLA